MILSILQQIHIFNTPYLIPNTYLWYFISYIRYTFFSTLDSALPSRVFMHLIAIRTKPSRCTSVKPGYHRFAYLWLTSSTHYPGYPIKKLTSITRGEDQLRPTGFSNSPPTVVLKGSKSQASKYRQSADKLDNLSYVRISEWKYPFWVIYILKWWQSLFT